MNVSRRTVLKIVGGGTLVINFLPRVAFAGRNIIKSVRTGLQPDNKTRLVIETSSRPSYSFSYPDGKLVILLSNTSANDYMQPKLASGTIITSINQAQVGSRAQITAALTKSIKNIPSNQIQTLEPTGDNGYRLVIDIVSETEYKAPAVVYGTTGASKSATRKNIIVIDAGHGGRDPGCIGRYGTREKDIVLSVAKILQKKLESSGYKVHLTRDRDIFLNLGTRADIAEKRSADLFVSLHANANPSRSVQGFSIYTLSKQASDQEAAKLAEAENASDKIDIDGFERYEPDIRNALSSLQQQAVSEMSVEYANGVVKSFNNKKITKLNGSNVRHAPFAVLKSTIPGALIELGHLSNKVEEKLLKDSVYQDKLATAISIAISNYKFED